LCNNRHANGIIPPIWGRLRHQLATTAYLEFECGGSGAEWLSQCERLRSKMKQLRRRIPPCLARLDLPWDDSNGCQAVDDDYFLGFGATCQE